VIVQYQTLPRQQRRAARKLAKQLLRTTLPVATEGRFGHTIRGALNTAFMKPENVVAVFTYDDGNGNWWGDVVLRKGQGTYQIGVAEDSPYRSREEALAHVEKLIGRIKAMREDPLVAEFRNSGINVQTIELLRVQHKRFGCGWIVRSIDTITSEADEFKKRHGINGNTDPTVFYYAEQAARAIVLITLLSLRMAKINSCPLLRLQISAKRKSLYGAKQHHFCLRMGLRISTIRLS
jgi:hypothetical protein